MKQWGWSSAGGNSTEVGDVCRSKRIPLGRWSDVAAPGTWAWGREHCASKRSHLGKLRAGFSWKRHQEKWTGRLVLAWRTFPRCLLCVAGEGALAGLRQSWLQCRDQWLEPKDSRDQASRHRADLSSGGFGPGETSQGFPGRWPCLESWLLCP